jgi:hypothetical protein
MPIAGVGQHDARRLADTDGLELRVASSIGSRCPKSGAAVITSAARTICCSLVTACAL